MRIKKIIVQDHIYLPNSRTGKFTYEFSDSGIVLGKINVFVAPNGYGKSTLVNLLGETNRNGFSSNLANSITFEMNSGSFKLAKNINERKDIKIHTIDFTEKPGYSYFSKRLITKKPETALIPIVEKCKKVGIKKLVKDKTIKISDCTDELLTKKNIDKYCAELNFDKIQFEDTVFELFENLLMSEYEFMKRAMKKKRLDEGFYLKLSEIIAGSERIYENKIALYVCLKKIFTTNEYVVVDYLLYKKNEKIFEEFKELIKTNFPNKNHDFEGKEMYRGYSFPMPLFNTYSTGEMDRLKLILNYITIKQKTTDTNSNYIVFIDQLFDNVDQLNLVICLKLFDKLVGENITVCFPTHLDPMFFKQINCANIRYTHAISANKIIKTNNIVLDYVIKRNQLDKIEEKNFFSSYCAHFSPDNLIISLHDNAYESEEFNKQIESEYNLYSENKEYCPISVTFYLRKKLEYKCYTKLEEDEKKKFLKIHGVINKLNYVAENCEIPLSFFLFTDLMNDIAHISSVNDYKIPFVKSKIEHLIIKQIIEEICE